MPEIQPPADLSAEEKRSFETAVARFEQAWHGPARPSIAEYLPGGGRLRGAVLRELVQIDLEFRRSRGDTGQESDYHAQFPELVDTAQQQSEASIRTTATQSLEGTNASHPDTPTTAHPIGGRFGRYDIVKELGQGAMGAVYLAHDTQLDRRVALKIPKFAGVKSQALLERFYREARAAANLRHPNLCPVYDVGEIDGQHYITMAFIEGRPLKDFSRAKKTQPERRTAAVIRRIALGLAEAHAQGIIHRDLKPANVMIDAKGEPVVMDFGLARRTAADDVQATQDGTILGTPAYMSPEQASGETKQIGPAADIYSLGVILYELLAGQLPFNGTVIALLKQIVFDEPQPPSKFRPGLDPRLEAICLKMMAKRAGDRYGSMEEAAQALGEYIKTAGKEPPGESSQSASLGAKRTEDKVADMPPAPSAGEEETESQLLPSIVTASQTSAIRRPPPRVPTSIAAPAKRPRPGLGVPRWLRHPAVLAGFGGFAALAVLLGVVLYLQLPGGAVLRIEVKDPQVEVQVKGNEVRLIGAEKKEIKLEAGEHLLIVRRGKFTFQTRSLVLQRGDNVTAIVELVDGDLHVVADGREILREKLPAEPGDYSLRFAGAGEQVDTSAVVLPTRGPWTVEAWVTPRDPLPRGGEASLVLMVNPVWVSLRNGPQGVRWAAGGPTSRPAPTIYADEKLTAGKRDHVAIVRTSAGVSFFVNGRLRGEPLPIVFFSPESSLRICPKGDPARRDISYYGDVDEVRVSSSERYHENFQPEPRFTPDAETLALYHFDEGEGEIIKDASSHKRDGKIVGTTWVKSGVGGGAVVPAPVPVVPAPAANLPAPAANLPVPAPDVPAANIVYLDDLQETSWENGAGVLAKHGNDHRGPIVWGGKTLKHSLFTHPHSNGTATVSYALDGKYDEFQATIGLVSRSLSRIAFRVLGDDKQLWESPPQSTPLVGTDVRVSVRGVRVLKLQVHCPGTFAFAHALWIDPRLTPAADAQRE